MRISVLLALAAVSGCSLTSDAGSSTFEVRFAAPSVVTDTEIDVHARLEVGDEVRTLSRSDFAPMGNEQLDALGLFIPATGAGSATCTVGRSGATSEGTIDFDVEDGYLYRITCSVQTGPVGCFGCRGTEDFPLNPALGFSDGARLYVSWGGDPADNLPVY